MGRSRLDPGGDPGGPKRGHGIPGRVQRGDGAGGAAVKRRWVLLWAVVVLALLALWIGLVTGRINFDPFANFYLLILAIAVIGILSIIGAVFLGIFIVYRIYYRQEFTPFEKEMLAMREDVKGLVAKVEQLLGPSAGNPGKKD